jgi:hypothetical protein
MKQILLILFLLTTLSVKSQTFFKRKSDEAKGMKKYETTSPVKIKIFLKNRNKENSLFHFKNAFRPKVSFDLDPAGIHLFNISDIGPLPVLNVSAKFSAGLIITI